MLVDVHVHLYPDERAGQQAKDRYVIWEYGDDPGVAFAPGPGDLDDLATTYAAAGFDRAVVVHLFDTDLTRQQAMARLAPGQSPGAVADALVAVERAAAEAMMQSNRWVAGVARANPLIEALVSVDPTVLAAPVLVEHLRELADQGVRGIKLHPVSQGFRPDDPRLYPIYDACQESGMVVLSHSGPGHHHGASARPDEFVPVLERWPDLRLVLAHLGGAAWRETAAVAAAFPEVAFDLSEIIEWIGAPNAPSAGELVELIRTIGADRVMLGSDFPWYDPAGTADRVMGLTGLGPDERAAILGGTAVERLALDEPSAAAR